MMYFSRKRFAMKTPLTLVTHAVSGVSFLYFIYLLALALALSLCQTHTHTHYGSNNSSHF